MVKIKLGAAFASLAMIITGLVSASPAQAASGIIWESASKFTSSAIPTNPQHVVTGGIGGKTTVGAKSLLAGPYYWYAGVRKTQTTTSVNAKLTVESPYTDVSGQDHSLGEIVVCRNNCANAVEIGWITNQFATGTQDTSLFVSAWRNGTWSGYLTPGGGTYVASCSASPCKQPGDVLISDPTGSVSAGIGAKQFYVGYDTATADWWFGYDNKYIGYIDSSWWGAVSPAFTSGDSWQDYGEVASNTLSPTCTRMGDGTFPTTTSGAYSSSMTINGTLASGATMFITDSTKYNALWPSGTPGGTYRYGGKVAGC